jgi:hypothetical protein
MLAPWQLLDVLLPPNATLRPRRPRPHDVSAAP